MIDLVMKGQIEAESDISVSPPDHTKKDGQATVSTLPNKGVWRGGSLVTTVYVPGSTIRGALRNGASRAVAAARAARQSRMTPDDFLLVAKGGIKDRKETGKDERAVDYEAADRLRREQPIISLFGAMAEKIAGRWQIGDAVPAKPLDPSRKGRGVRSHPFQRQPDLAHFMDSAAYEAFLVADQARVEANLAEDEAESLDKKIASEKKSTEPDTEKIKEWTAESERLREEFEKLKKEAGGVVNIQQPLGGWQAIPEGTRMRHRMRLRDVTETDLAWAFFALRCLAREGRIGAHESRGDGYFSAEYDLRLAKDGGDFEPCGRLRVADFGVELESGNADLKTVFERSRKVLDDLPGDAA